EQIYCYFFFQAEDGIRDRNVTGVQTCALPICSSSFDGLSRPDHCCDTSPLRHQQQCEATAALRTQHRPALTARVALGEAPIAPEIGRASCRERVETSRVAGGGQEKGRGVEGER